jgi:hypothetical protein
MPSLVIAVEDASAHLLEHRRAGTIERVLHETNWNNREPRFASTNANVLRAVEAIWPEAESATSPWHRSLDPVKVEEKHL